jgi:hypothetical protein
LWLRIIWEYFFSTYRIFLIHFKMLYYIKKTLSRFKNLSNWLTKMFILIEFPFNVQTNFPELIHKTWFDFHANTNFNSESSNFNWYFVRMKKESFTAHSSARKLSKKFLSWFEQISQVNHILTDALELFKMTLLVQSF